MLDRRSTHTRFAKLLIAALVTWTAKCALAESGAHTTPTRAASSPRTTQSDRVVDARIVACYPKNKDCSACSVLENRSTYTFRETTRHFINLPKDLYPKMISGYFRAVKGNPTAGWVSNAGAPGEAENAPEGCWSTYVEFDGVGAIELRVPSTRENVPDYVLHLLITDAE